MSNKDILPHSFEMFPSQSDGVEGFPFDIFDHYYAKSVQNKSFISITHGALGSSKKRTVNLISKIHSLGYDVNYLCPHLSCANMGEGEMLEILDTYKELGINKILVIGGDSESGKDPRFKYASEAMSLISSKYSFTIYGASYPEVHPRTSPFTLDREIEIAKIRLDAGCKFLVTQFCWNHPDLYAFYEKAVQGGFEKSLVIGIIKPSKATISFAKKCGAKTPQTLLENCNQEYYDNLYEECITNALSLNVSGVHFYTLNKIL